MKALILVGGYGTRLRPLTLSVPKPLIQFCNRSIVEHQVSALVKAGVRHVILAVAYQPDAMDDAIKSLETRYGIKVTCSREEEPLGTAGPIRLARDLLRSSDDEENEAFFVCNSDVICEFPLQEMLEFHRKHGGEGTILVTKVSDPSVFGVVVSDADGRIERFVEKPKEFVGDNINAGLYVLNKSAIDRIDPRPTSIEKEIFPAMASAGVLHSFQLEGYWADIGKPKDFLTGTELFLEGLRNAEVKGNQIEEDAKLAQGSHILGNVLIDKSAVILEGALIGPNVTIGPNCKIGKGVRLSNTAVMSDVSIEDYSWVSRSIIGWKSNIEKWVRIEGLTVVGQDVKIRKECYINKCLILPHKVISDSIYQEGQIVM